MRYRFYLFLKILVPIFFAIFLTHCGPTKPDHTRLNLHAPTIKILLSDQPFVRIELHGTFRLNAPEATYVISEKTGTLWCQYKNGLLTLTAQTRRWTFQSGFPISIQPVNQSSFFEIEGRNVQGLLTIVKVSEERIYYILHTDLESYLLGVVPAEIPTGNPDYLAAVEAQAVAARSYAWKKMKANRKQLYHVKDNQWDQVLGDMRLANHLVREAVSRTRGLILAPENDQFIPYFHSTCGGMFLAFDGNDFSIPRVDGPATDSIAWCSISPLYRWYKIFSVTDVINKLNFDSINPRSSRQLSLVINHRNKLGYVDAMKIQLNYSKQTLKQYEIRKFFKDSLKNNLPSNWFLMAPMQQDSTQILLVGAGYGHGKGMCQWGAIGMSLAGFNRQQILSHYYPGISIRRIY